MSDNAQEWRWVGEDGVEKTVLEQELIAELSSESLPNYTLVWKKGWLEWLPAMQVAELSWALPAGKSDQAVKPREKESAAVPPAPPLYRYPVLKRRAASLRSDKPPPARAPLTAPRPAGKGELEPKTTLLEPKTTVYEPPTAALPDQDPNTLPQQARPSEPDSANPPSPPSRPFEEVELDAIEASNPMAAEDLSTEADSVPSAPGLFGAMPPAAGSFSGRAYGDEDDAETRVIPSKPPPPLGPLYVGPHAPPPSERPPPSYDEPSTGSPRPPAPIYDEEDEEIPRIPPPPADLAAYAGMARERSAGSSALGPRSLYLTAAGTLALAAGIVALLLRGSASSESPAPSESATAVAASSAVVPSGSASAAPPVGKAVRAVVDGPRKKTCATVTPATKIADWAEPGITPNFSAIPGSERIAVGFGQSDTYAVGITIDSRTLDRDQVFREFRKMKLVSVVPTTSADKLHFQVVRDGSALDNARAVDAEPPFYLGTTATGVSRAVGKTAPELVWASAGTDDATVPRVATLRGKGHAVTLRRGGQSGHVAAGWLDPSGARRTELVDVRTDRALVGTPTIAASDDRVLIAFAGRRDKASRWGVLLATAKANELPEEATPFELPSGGPGGEGISPAAAPLPGGRWLLEWTEGASGNRVVRAAVLDANLSVLTAAVSLSPEGMNAGQGVVLSHADSVAVLFYVQTDKKGHELWGATIDCPE